MKFLQLAEFFESIEQTSSRLTITHHLAELFAKMTSEEIEKTIYILQGRVAPIFEKTEFGMAEKTAAKAVIAALNIEKNFFNQELKKFGDLGKTVEFFKKQYRSFEENSLSLIEVFNGLHALATASGEGSQEKKIALLANLIRQLDALSCRYLVRIPLGIMRLGFSDMTVLDAFSWMITKDKSLRPAIEKAFHVRPDLGYIGKILKDKGIEGLKKIQPKLFNPILMMRAERLSSGEEIIKKIGECAVEPKYDGFRVQIHFDRKKNEVRLYSRNLEDVSFMYPDIIEGVKKETKAHDAIFEGEAIGFDPVNGSFLPFQETVQRKRKYGIEEKAKEIPLKLFTFDILYADQENYLYIPFHERRKKLENIIHTTGNVIKDTVLVASQEIIHDGKKLELMFDEAISKGLEGIVAKKLDGVYQAGARGWNWIKFKRSYSSKIEDTIDCLVMGYDLGKGKRTGFGIGAFLVGVYDEKNDEFTTVAKIGTGLTDEEWRQLQVQSAKLKVEKKPRQYNVDKAMECDVWITPKIVMEIKADEITRSPVHTAGRVMKPSKNRQAVEVDVSGYALRFPRLERFREDKKSEDVTSLKEVMYLYKRQEK